MTKTNHIPEPPETVKVNATRVSCDGGKGALGHPRVFLAMDPSGEVTCPYCDRLFLLDGKPSAEHH